MDVMTIKRFRQVLYEFPVSDLKGLIDVSNSLCHTQYIYVHYLGPTSRVPFIFLGPARIPLVISRGRHSSRNNVRCPPSLLMPYLLMNLLAWCHIVCVLCLGFDYLSFSLSIPSFNSIISSYFGECWNTSFIHAIRLDTQLFYLY